MHYATGEREAKRACIGLEQAGTEFERAASPLVRQMNAIEQRQAHERAVQHQKMLEPEQPKQKQRQGPTMGQLSGENRAYRPCFMQNRGVFTWPHILHPIRIYQARFRWFRGSPAATFARQTLKRRQPVLAVCVMERYGK